MTKTLKTNLKVFEMDEMTHKKFEVANLYGSGDIKG